MTAMREQDLYAPVKALLTRQGYEVKGEVGAADVVAVHRLGFENGTHVFPRGLA